MGAGGNERGQCRHVGDFDGWKLAGMRGPYVGRAGRFQEEEEVLNSSELVFVCIVYE